MIPTPDSRSAKRSLERAVDALKDVLRADNIREVGGEFALSYFYPQSNNRAVFERRVAAIDTKFTQVHLTGIALVRAGYDLVTRLVAEEKAAKEARKAKTANIAKVRKELKLEDDVEFTSDVDVGQYKTILAALDPIRQHVYETVKTELYAELERFKKLLAATIPPYDSNAVAPRPGVFDNRETYHRKQNYAARLSWFTKPVDNHKNIVAVREDIGSMIRHRAAAEALGAVQGYAAKMAVKVTERAPGVAIDSVAVTAAGAGGLWSYSYLDVVLVNKATQRWHTQIIINRSVYNKLFNQWPTRLLS